MNGVMRISQSLAASQKFFFSPWEKIPEVNISRSNSPQSVISVEETIISVADLEDRRQIRLMKKREIELVIR